MCLMGEGDKISLHLAQARKKLEQILSKNFYVFCAIKRVTTLHQPFVWHWFKQVAFSLLSVISRQTANLHIPRVPWFTSQQI